MSSHPLDRHAAAARLSLWQRLRLPPDEILADAGEVGERVVAALRLWVTVLLLVLAAGRAGLAGHLDGFARTDLAATGLALAYAVAVRVALARGQYRPWLGLATTVVDVSAVSLYLAAVVAGGAPHAAVNAKAPFEVYYLTLVAAGLRYDVRLCLVTGILAAGQYLALLLYTTGTHELASPLYAPFLDGAFAWDAQVARLAVLASGTALGVAVVLRAQELRLLSTIDRLTGLSNRGHLDERLVAEVARARRLGLPCTVAMLDLDHFKRFNDSLGHAAGDAALRAVAALVRRSLRKSDLVGRYGGEELVVVLPDTPVAAGLDKLERLRHAVAQLAVPTPQGEVTGLLTVSVGVASYPADGDEADAVLAVADDRLFRAKGGGRDRVVGP